MLTISEPVEYIVGADLPDLPLVWLDYLEGVIDLSAATFEVKVGKPGRAAEFTKASGVTGSATEPNIVISWATANELNTLAPGKWMIQVKATVSGKDRLLQVPLLMKRAVT